MIEQFILGGNRDRVAVQRWHSLLGASRPLSYEQFILEIIVIGWHHIVGTHCREPAVHSRRIEQFTFGEAQISSHGKTTSLVLFIEF